MAQASDKCTALHMLMSNLTKFPQFPSVEKALKQYHNPSLSFNFQQSMLVVMLI